MDTFFTVVFGLLGFVAAIFLVVYFKMFIAKLFNHRVIDRRGRTVIEPDSFDNLNEHIKEKITDGAKSIILSSKEIISRYSGIIESKKLDKLQKLNQLQQLKANGTITEEEFSILKADIFKK